MLATDKFAHYNTFLDHGIVKNQAETVYNTGKQIAYIKLHLKSIDTIKYYILSQYHDILIYQYVLHITINLADK